MKRQQTSSPWEIRPHDHLCLIYETQEEQISAAALYVKLGLEKEAGVVIINPFSASPDYPLQRWDVLLKIGDEPVDSQGNINAKDGLRLSCQYLVPKLAKDGQVKLTIFRDRKTIEVQVPVPPDGNLVIPYS